MDLLPTLRFAFSKIFGSKQSPPSYFILGRSDQQISLTLCPGQLCDPDNRRFAGESFVRRITHLKQSAGALHELILVDVVHDTPNQRHATFVQIDRYGGVGPRPKTSSPPSLAPLFVHEADDVVWLPGSRTRASYTFDQYVGMLRRGHGYQLLRTTTLSVQSMSIARFIIMAKALYEVKSSYDILQTQYFWYAGLLVDMAAEEFGMTVEVNNYRSNAGTWNFVPIAAKRPEIVGEILQVSRDSWRSFCESDTTLTVTLQEVVQLRKEIQRVNDDAHHAREELAAWKLDASYNRAVEGLV